MHLLLQFGLSYVALPHYALVVAFALVSFANHPQPVILSEVEGTPKEFALPILFEPLHPSPSCPTTVASSNSVP